MLFVNLDLDLRPFLKAYNLMTKAAILGWIIMGAGTALWLYGYLVTGHPSLVDWRAITPWWIADWLPNMEAEIGIILMFAGMVPVYWPARD